MPGRLFIAGRSDDIARFFGVPAPATGPVLPDDDIAPGRELLALDDAGTLRALRWGMIMPGRKTARRRPLMDTVVNARAETVFDKRTFEGVRRAIVPAHGWFEWTGEARRKRRWRFAAADGGLLAFAAIFSTWTAPGGASLYQCATLTCEPNDLVRPIHHRMGVILAREFWREWLSGGAVPLGAAPSQLLAVCALDGKDP